MRNKKNIIALIIIVAQLAITTFIAFQLPDNAQIPSHWNFKGEVDNYTGKWVSVFLFSGINLAILLLMAFLPFYSVRYKNAEERFKKLIPDMTLILVSFFALIHIFTYLQAANIISLSIRFIWLIMGFMFIFLGNLLPKVPSNFYLGIRTPWSLSSERVWRKTHRLGGICFFILGLLMIISSLIGNQNQLVSGLLASALIVLIIIPLLFSFIWYKQERK